MNWRPPSEINEDARADPRGPTLDPERRLRPAHPRLRVPNGLETRPPRVEYGCEHIRERLADSDHVLVCLDFDGTLAPISDDPDAPELTAANRETLESLTGRDDVSLAVISGRSLADVRSRVDVDGLDYSGNHGLELLVDDEHSTHPLAAARLPTLRRVRDQLETRLGPLDGVALEDKRLTLTVHTRLASPADAELARRRTEAVVEAIGENDLRIETGKGVLELLPDIPTGKDLAVRLLRKAAPVDVCPVYLGDDTADEAAFQEVADDGISIHVGNGAETAADYRVDGPDDVARFLHWLGDNA